MLDESDPKFFDENYDVTISGSNILWTSWRDGHTQIYLYSFDERNPMAGEAKLVRQLTSGDGEVSSIKAVDPANRWSITSRTKATRASSSFGR